MKRLFPLILVIFFTNLVFAQNIEVEFRVDMSIQAQEGLFTPGTDSVKIAGNFNGWNNGADVLTHQGDDLIYSITIDTFSVNDTLFFKFIKGDAGWENDPNREYIVPEMNSVYTGYFNNDSVFTPSLSVTFSVNMEYEIVSGRFEPSEDTLSVRGDFNGWSSDDLLSQSVGDPNVYELTKDLPVFVGDTINYKYAFVGPDGTSWEGDPNKTYTFTEEDSANQYAIIERTFNDATLETLTNNPVTIKFTVDVRGAISSVTGTAFPSHDNVVIAGAVSPLTWPTGGWPDADSNVVIFLNDNGEDGDVTANDSIWSKDITFPKYTILRVQYKYGMNWGLESNTGGNDNESSVGTDHFINLTSDMVSGTVENVWSEMGDHELVDVIVTGIKELDSPIPSRYELSQNYPNPFNPVTMIRFSIPEAGLVTLKIHNIIGEEIATLVNEVRNAGIHEVDFNALNLNSGVYFYTITSGNFTSTKKMLLIK